MSRAPQCGRVGVGILRADEHALHEYQAFPIVVGTGRPLEVWQRRLPGQCAIERLVHVPFDDEEPRHPAGHLIVRGAVGMRVVPVCAGRVRLVRVALHMTKPELVVRLAGLLVVSEEGNLIEVSQERARGIGGVRLALPEIGLRHHAEDHVV